jgi:glutathione S-transferase
MRVPIYRVHGMQQSYFTRKITGYLDYKGIAWRFRPFTGMSPAAMAAGFPGGIPMVETPDGAMMWDSTAMIHHLELRFPEPSITPVDPVQRFVSDLIEDFSDEWLYRPAVGTRWHFPENAAVAGYELARDFAATMPPTCDQAHAMVGAHVLSSCPALGVTPENVQRWVDDVLRPWQRALGAHLAARPYVFGGRAALADFALFGGNVAHFANDPLCRRWIEEDGPAIVRHTHRLLAPEDEEIGDWDDASAPAPTLIGLVAEIARTYLPWVSRACADGAADVIFADGSRVTIAATPFLREARATLLARYAAARSPQLDETLAAAGALTYFADWTHAAGTVPNHREPPRPALNRPFPPPGA